MPEFKYGDRVMVLTHKLRPKRSEAIRRRALAGCCATIFDVCEEPDGSVVLMVKFDLMAGRKPLVAALHPEEVTNISHDGADPYTWRISGDDRRYCLKQNVRDGWGLEAEHA